MSAVRASSVGQGDLSVISKLTNLNDINRLLHETVVKERAIDAELDRQLQKRCDLERSILVLNAATSEVLELVHADSEQLLSGVAATAKLAERISSHVRRLDATQGRVTDTLRVINLILERTTCIAGVQSAMAAEDFESAARHVAAFLELGRFLDPSMGAMDSAQVEEQRQVLLAAKVRLEALLEQRLEAAAAARDRKEVLRLCRLYPLLGRGADGLAKLLAFLKAWQAEVARGVYDALSEQLDGAGAAKADWVGTLSNLFRQLAVAAEEEEETVAEAFGRPALVDVVLAVQGVCDTHGARLLQRYGETRQIARLVRSATTGKKAAGAGDSDASLDPRQLEPLVQEMALLAQRCEEYSSYMLGKARTALAPDPLPHTSETALRGGGFAVAVRELVGAYLSLEEHYLRTTALMAIRIDEAVPGAPTSSCVDDVFFIARKCATRALATANVQCAAALLGEVNNLLANEFRSALHAKLAGGPARLMALAEAEGGGAGTAPGAGDDVAAAGRAHAVAINNADVSAEYVAKLRQEMELYVADVFAAPGERERLRSCLADLAKTAGDVRSMAGRALEALADAALPRLRPALDGVAQASYQLREADYTDLPPEETWVGQVLVALELCTRPLQPLLTAAAWEGAFHALLDKLLGRLEVLLGRKPFTQLGGLQLDRDVRALVAALGEMTTRTVRDKSARLTQMGTVLSLESVDEFLDYWRDDTGHVTWRLAPGEVKALLAQRVDFSKEAVAALAL